MLIIITALLCSGFSNEGTWIIKPESKLAIYGTTNINSFICEIESYSGHDTLHYFNNYSAGVLEFTTNRMTIPIRNFDCGSRQISQDFWTTLKSDTYPKLDIDFISLQTTTVKNGSFVKGIVDITLAGVTTRYNMGFSMCVKDGTVQLSGKHPVSFADFGLKAPEKLKGLIRVQDVLHVEFHLVLKSV